MQRDKLANIQHTIKETQKRFYGWVTNDSQYYCLVVGQTMTVELTSSGPIVHPLDDRLMQPKWNDTDKETV
jgi:hypothetical protein